MLYLLTFHFMTEDNREGWGDCNVRFEQERPTYKELSDFREALKEKLGAGTVVIVNYLPLREEE